SVVHQTALIINQGNCKSEVRGLEEGSFTSSLTVQDRLRESVPLAWLHPEAGQTKDRRSAERGRIGDEKGQPIRGHQKLDADTGRRNLGIAKPFNGSFSPA
ncbi:hypothetical protein CLAIMM_02193, partial [Cladophialophora immunda]